MSSTYIPVRFRKLVYESASGGCEYCLMPEQLSLISFAIDHIIAEKHGGQTQSDNLALSCPLCNRYKGSDIASLDPQTGHLCALYNPRLDIWIEHFVFSSSALFSLLSAKGRVTSKILKLNQTERIVERRLLLEAEFLNPPVQNRDV